MSQDSFQVECDRISQVVDAIQFERIRWARTEGPMLAQLVSLAQSAIEERHEFELIEEGATSDIKRFVLKVHSNRVVAIVIWLENGHGIINAEVLERSKYSLLKGDPISAEFGQIDGPWMARALQELFGRIGRQAIESGAPSGNAGY